MSQLNSVVLITGAASGMGKLALERAALQGETVVGFDLNEQGLKTLESRFNNVTTFKVDITDYKAVSDAVDYVRKSLGPIKRVLNCAGIMPLGSLRSQQADDITKIMSVNYIGTVNINKAVLPSMTQQRSGEIVNFASIAGWAPMLAFGAYNAAKSAVINFTEVLHHENKRNGIKVCCACPPAVNTPLFKNANIRPKYLDVSPAVEPEFVLDSIEESLAKGQWLCIPGWKTKLSYYMRRFTPELLWSLNHFIEGKDLGHIDLQAEPKADEVVELKQCSNS
ncbi:MAG: SDR family NAD(P)-dependent oxidoreductase [Pseudomonadales bacterium]|nr:SDR family NAD(P)-dependent oxidoreductase [Pseudomonadales bacterium]